MTNIEELVVYFQSRRGVGHTWAMLHGALASKDCIVVASDKRQQQEFNLEGVPRSRIIPLSELSCLHGESAPVVIDHHALVMMLGDLVRENQELRAHNAKLRREAGK